MTVIHRNLFLKVYWKLMEMNTLDRISDIFSRVVFFLLPVCFHIHQTPCVKGIVLKEENCFPGCKGFPFKEDLCFQRRQSHFDEVVNSHKCNFVHFSSFNLYSFLTIHVHLLLDKKKKVETEQPGPSHPVPQSASQPVALAPAVSSGSSTTQHHVAIPPQSHHFSFSIDLRSIKSLESSTTQFVFIR